MKMIKSWIARLPMKWKLTLGASLILCFLFVAYNTAQYIVINGWLLKQEEKSVQKNMDEILVYFQEKKSSLDLVQVKASQPFLEKLKQANQMIRILDNMGNPVLTIAEESSKQWIAPQFFKEPEISNEWHSNDHFLVMRKPLVTPQFTGTIEIVNNLEKFDKVNDILTFFMLAGALGAIVLSFLGGTLLSRQLLKPIHNLTETITKIKQKGLRERVHVLDNGDEISNLGIMFNEMMEKLEASFMQQEQFIEDASHELRTPIAIIEGHLSLLHRWGKQDPAILDESLQASLQEVSRLKELVQELLALSRAEATSPKMSLEWVDPSKSIPNLIKKFTILHPHFTFNMELESIAGKKIPVLPHHLEQILLILLDNAVKYSTNQKNILIRGSLQENRLQIEVIDKGMGIPKAYLPYVFDRFYRVDKARSRLQGGNGLGLSIAKRLVEKYHGSIHIDSSEDHGTGVILTFSILKEIKLI